MAQRPGGTQRQSTALTTQTNRTARTARTSQTRNNESDYSLAGPSRPRRPQYDPHNTYVQDGYRDLNPWMEQEKSDTAFSLAGTFPRLVRWNHKCAGEDDTKAIAQEEKGQTESAPQVGEAQQQGDRTGDANDDHEPDIDSGAPTEVGDSDDTFIDDDDIAFRDQLERGNTAIKHHRIQAVDSDGSPQGIIGDQPIALQHDPTLPEKGSPFNRWALVRARLQYPLAEWLGTTLYIFLGVSANLSVATSEQQAGSMQSMYWSWGFAVMLGIYVSAGGSGGFLNPSLTVMLCVFRGFPSKRIPVYVLAQLLGAFTGALLAFAVYKDDILHLDGALLPDSTGISFYTQPKPWVSASSAFFTELLGSAVLGGAILALGDSGNAPPGAGMHAFIIGLLITTLVMALGYNTSGCFNPVRDLGPRLATMAVGYPRSLFTASDNWWIWGPWGATVTGALVGGLVYDLCIFKGGESPVNYSITTWKVEGKKRESTWLRRFGKPRQADAVDRELEDGIQ